MTKRSMRVIHSNSIIEKTPAELQGAVESWEKAHKGLAHNISIRGIEGKGSWTKEYSGEIYTLIATFSRVVAGKTARTRAVWWDGRNKQKYCYFAVENNT